MNKMYMIKFTTMFIKDYFFTSGELMNYEVLLDEIEKIVKISLEADNNFKCFYENVEQSDIIVEIKEVVDGDELKDFEDYLITFTHKYDSEFFNLKVNNKEVFCF